MFSKCVDIALQLLCHQNVRFFYFIWRLCWVLLKLLTLTIKSDTNIPYNRFDMFHWGTSRWQNLVCHMLGPNDKDILFYLSSVGEKKFDIHFLSIIKLLGSQHSRVCRWATLTLMGRYICVQETLCLCPSGGMYKEN